MNNIEKYIKDLKHIIDLLDKKLISDEHGALSLFELHIDEVSKLSRFSNETWKYPWRRTVYDFGTKFKSIDPIDFLKILSNKKKGLDKDSQEVLDFYYSEIEVNSLPEDTCTSNIEILIQKYPYNPEFRHTFGHFCQRKKQYLKAIEQYRFALDKDKNISYVGSLYSAYSRYFEELFERSEYENGYEICEALVQEKILSGFNDNFYQIKMINNKDRFKDYINLNKVIKDANKMVEDKIAKEANIGQLKIIEVLGFFTAIIAFVFSTVSFGTKFEFREAIVFNISLGIILVIFALVISLLFSKKDIKKSDGRIWILVALISSLIIFTVIIFLL